MPNLNASLTTLTNSLRAFERSMESAQNNVANASTPGYAKQTARMQALPFDLRQGYIGGVHAQTIQSARDRFAELAVQRQNSGLGQYKESAALLGSLNEILDISGPGGIPAGLNSLLQSFSAWSVAPQSGAARQDVVHQAEQFASAIRSVARQVEEVAEESGRRLQSAVAQINALGERIAGINRQRSQSPAGEASLDTELHNALDELAKLANFTTLTGENGQVTVLLGGQTALTVGANSFPLRATLAEPPGGGPQQWRFLDANGQDVNLSLSSGSVRALLDFQTRTIPSLIGGQGQTGRLNELATAFAARVNGLLTSGQVSPGDATTGIALFSFGSGDPHKAASSFQLNQSVTPAELAARLAAAQSGPPVAANGVALELAGLLDRNKAGNLVDGTDFLSFYGRAASEIGSGLEAASNWQERSESLLAQAKAMRQEISGVSLDEEAARIIELQRGHQALSRVIVMIEKMTDSVMSILG